MERVSILVHDARLLEDVADCVVLITLVGCRLIGAEWAVRRRESTQCIVCKGPAPCPNAIGDLRDVASWVVSVREVLKRSVGPRGRDAGQSEHGGAIVPRRRDAVSVLNLCPLPPRVVGNAGDVSRYGREPASLVEVEGHWLAIWENVTDDVPERVVAVRHHVVRGIEQPALLRDRDQVYGEQFRHRVQGMRIEEVLMAPHSPWQNPFAERLIGSIRRECLDHVLVLGESHLRRILARYFSYYHRARTHLALDKDAPDVRPVELPEAGGIVEIPEVGGLHHRYVRQAA